MAQTTTASDLPLQHFLDSILHEYIMCKGKISSFSPHELLACKFAESAARNALGLKDGVKYEKAFYGFTQTMLWSMDVHRTKIMPIRDSGNPDSIDRIEKKALLLKGKGLPPSAIELLQSFSEKKEMYEIALRALFLIHSDVFGEVLQGWIPLNGFGIGGNVRPVAGRVASSPGPSSPSYLQSTGPHAAVPSLAPAAAYGPHEHPLLQVSQVTITNHYRPSADYKRYRGPRTTNAKFTPHDPRMALSQESSITPLPAQPLLHGPPVSSPSHGKRKAVIWDPAPFNNPLPKTFACRWNGCGDCKVSTGLYATHFYVNHGACFALSRARASRDAGSPPPDEGGYVKCQWEGCGREVKAFLMPDHLMSCHDPLTSEDAFEDARSQGEQAKPAKVARHE